jgi:hypothetical protein
MTKTKLIGGIMVMVLILSGSTAVAATNEQVYAKSNAPIATEALSKSVVNEARAKVKPNSTCKNWLVKELKNAGFKGRGLRIAWSIAMRESGGRANAISSTGDYGVFQFNRAAWSKEPWWNTTKLLTRDYNVMIAYRISQHGKTFYPWDIDGAGRHKGLYTPKSVYKKYKSWYNKFPSNCK